MPATGGSGEIKASNRRVSFAKKAVASFAKIAKESNDEVRAAEDSLISAENSVIAARAALKAAADSAKAVRIGLEAARKKAIASKNDHDEAKKELKDAQECLKAALKKWEVVDLVEEDDDEGKQNINNNINKKRAAVTDRKNGEEESNGNENKRVRHSSDIPEEVTVEGCGTAEANGTYKRDFTTPMIVYSKTCRRYGKYAIFRQHFWYICKGGYGLLYFAEADQSNPVPPADGWNVMTGSEPTPKITVKP